MAQMMKYLMRNRLRYFKHFFKTFAPVLSIIAVISGVFLYTSGKDVLHILTEFPFEQYSVFAFLAISVIAAGRYFFSSRSGIYIYHATLHYFYNTQFLSELIFCMYLKKAAGCILAGFLTAGLLYWQSDLFWCCWLSVSSYIFSAAMLQWFKFHAKDTVRLNVWLLTMSVLFFILKNFYFPIGILGTAGILLFAKRFQINYTKWMEECAFVDEASFASAKQNLARMYRVQSMVKARRSYRFSYPIWNLKKWNNIIQKSVIRMLREEKRMWIIWSIPFFVSVLLELALPQFMYADIVRGFAACFLLSAVNQYLYRDFFEMIDKAERGLFLPYSPTALILQGMTVPTAVFLLLDLMFALFSGMNPVRIFILLAGWVLSFAGVIAYRVFKGNPPRWIIALQNIIIAGLTMGAIC